MGLRNIAGSLCHDGNERKPASPQFIRNPSLNSINCHGSAEPDELSSSPPSAGLDSGEVTQSPFKVDITMGCKRRSKGIMYVFAITSVQLCETGQVILTWAALSTERDPFKLKPKPKSS